MGISSILKERKVNKSHLLFVIRLFSRKREITEKSSDRVLAEKSLGITDSL